MNLLTDNEGVTFQVGDEEYKAVERLYIEAETWSTFVYDVKGMIHCVIIKDQRHHFLQPDNTNGK